MSPVKTWLRLTIMMQDRFLSLLILHIERDISNNINVYEFTNTERRILLK